ncbi:MAG: hemerythrin domain-containing protein [Pseudomonadota bacterium]|nr:hemerythrin domain-containing protein [Pseudomonadota bacterium]
MPEVAALITDILDTHHRHLYEHMPRLDEAFRDAPEALARPWAGLVAVLEDHLAREEEVLFPAMLAQAEGGPAGDLQPVIAAMLAEHDVIRGFERALRGVSSLAGPHEAELLALLDDLAVHAEREDTQLFPLGAA